MVYCPDLSLDYVLLWPGNDRAAPRLLMKHHLPMLMHVVIRRRSLGTGRACTSMKAIIFLPYRLVERVIRLTLARSGLAFRCLAMF